MSIGGEIIVFGRKNPVCPYCENLKSLFEVKKVDYVYKDISEEGNYLEFCKLRLRTVPAVFVDGVFVGGFTEVSKMF